MSAESDIHDTITTYFQCMYESSAEKTHAAFHPNATITGYLNGKFSEMTVADFATAVSKLQPSPKDKGEPERLEVVSLEIAGDTAVARVRDDYIGLTFFDTLSFVKVDNQWQIYNKLYHVEGKSEQ